MCFLNNIIWSWPIVFRILYIILFHMLYMWIKKVEKFKIWMLQIICLLYGFQSLKNGTSKCCFSVAFFLNNGNVTLQTEKWMEERWFRLKLLPHFMFNVNRHRISFRNCILFIKFESVLSLLINQLQIKKISIHSPSEPLCAYLQSKVIESFAVVQTKFHLVPFYHFLPLIYQFLA